MAEVSGNRANESMTETPGVLIGTPKTVGIRATTESCRITWTIITILARIRHWRGTRRLLERSKRRRKARSSQSLKSAGCAIVIDEPHNVSYPVSFGVISIKSMDGLPARVDIDVRCRRVTRRQREIESSIRRGDRRRVIREWALHRQDGIFGMDSRLKTGGSILANANRPSGSKPVVRIVNTVRR
jgi:hypothetical protein